MNQSEFNMTKRWIITVAIGLMAMIILTASMPFFTVTPGYEVIHLRLGQMRKVCKEPGVYFRIPFIDSTIYCDCRIQKLVSKTEAFSHDLQTVDLEVAINYRVKDSWLIYKNIGTNYEQTVIDPLTAESVKAIIAKFSAEELTQNRHEAKKLVKDDLARALDNVHVQLVDFNFVHADFHSDFIKAVESKQIAEQFAKRSKFETENAKELAVQIKLKADAEAYAMKVKKDEVSDKLALLKAIEKWDGKLPEIMTGNTPIMLPLNKGQ